MGAPYSAAVVPRDAGSSQSVTSVPSGTPSSSRAATRRFGFPKSKRLLKKKDFRRVYEEGSRLQSSSFSMVRRNREDGECTRIGFSVPRALGGSVIRNRIRRRLREAIRLEYWRLHTGWDLVFHPRKAALEAPMPGLRREVERILAKCGPS